MGEELLELFRGFFAARVGRVRKNKIVNSGSDGGEESEHISPNCLSVFESGFFQIFFDGGDGVVRSIDESGVFCSAAQRFQTERAGAGEQIEHSASRNNF